MKLILIRDNRTNLKYFEFVGRVSQRSKFPRLKKLNLYEPFTKQYRLQTVLIDLVKVGRKYSYVEVLKQKESK